jgi:hypothetical protein
MNQNVCLRPYTWKSVTHHRNPGCRLNLNSCTFLKNQNQFDFELFILEMNFQSILFPRHHFLRVNIHFLENNFSRYAMAVRHVAVPMGM